MGRRSNRPEWKAGDGTRNNGKKRNFGCPKKACIEIRNGFGDKGRRPKIKPLLGVTGQGVTDTGAVCGKRKWSVN